ncbi:MAG: hypothetical protein VX681_05895 [Myxococcota bacterium]|nr:hypothetical protein [Myxococcota bacterium]
MSVTGEFSRLVEDCIAFLDASGAPQTDRWKQILQRAAERSVESLSAAADEVLALLENDGAPPAFDEPHERDEFARLAEHLGAICRALLGRSADTSAQSGDRP